MNGITKAPHAFNAPGEQVTLYTGEIGTAGGPSRPGRVVLTQVSQPGLEWALDPPVGHVGVVDRGETSITLDRLGEVATLPAYHRDQVSGWLNAVQVGDPNADLVRVVVHWINMPATCSPERTVDEQGTVSGRWRFSVGSWDLTLDQRPDLPKTWDAIGQTGSIAITHVMEIRTADGGTFTSAEVAPLLETLQYGMSFALGRWTSPALPVGFTAKGQPAWEEWAPVFCDAGARGSVGWWTSGTTDELIELLTLLLPRFESPSAFTMRFLLASCVEAGLARFVEHRVLAAFSAIEHLSWTVLKLRDKRTRDDYDQLKGAGRLTELLNRARVSVKIPSTSLPALAAFAQANKGPHGPLDGPTAVVRVRNKIVHPKGP